MVKPTDRELMAIEKIIRDSSQEERAHHAMEAGATQGSTRVGHEAERDGGTVCRSLYCGFCHNEWLRVNKLS